MPPSGQCSSSAALWQTARRFATFFTAAIGDLSCHFISFSARVLSDRLPQELLRHCNTYSRIAQETSIVGLHRGQRSSDVEVLREDIKKKQKMQFSECCCHLVLQMIFPPSRFNNPVVNAVQTCKARKPICIHKLVSQATATEDGTQVFR